MFRPSPGRTRTRRVVDERKQYVNPCSVWPIGHIPTGPLVSIHGEDGSGPTNLNTCSDVPRRLEKSTGVTARLATAPRNVWFCRFCHRRTRRSRGFPSSLLGFHSSQLNLPVLRLLNCNCTVHRCERPCETSAPRVTR
jgi:hypothetical protein